MRASTGRISRSSLPTQPELPIDKVLSGNLPRAARGRPSFTRRSRKAGPALRRAWRQLGVLVHVALGSWEAGRAHERSLYANGESAFMMGDMSRVLRVLLLDSRGRPKRYPVSRYGRLLETDSQERIPECAGGCARFVEAVVETVNRKPLRVIHVGFHQFRIGSDGLPDRRSLEDQLRLGIESLGEQRMDGNLLCNEGLWAKKAFHDRYKWRPTPFQARLIRRTLLEKARIR